MSSLHTSGSLSFDNKSLTATPAKVVFLRTWPARTLVALTATTALASPLYAADPLKLSLGGFAEYYMVALTQKPLNHHAFYSGGNDQQKPRGFQMYWEDAEIWFSASTQLDNGVTVSYRVEMETRNADVSGSDVEGLNYLVNSTTNRTLFRDQHQIAFTGGFGRFEIGDTDGAANSMQYSAPWVTKIGVVDGTDLLLNPSFNQAGIGTKTGEFNRNNRINYFTPRFAPGFQFGVSYAPENGSTGRGSGGADGNAGPVQTEEDNGDFQDITELGINFVRSMNGIDVAWSLTGVYAPLEECEFTKVGAFNGCSNFNYNVDRYIVHNGFQVSFAGWTIGAGASVDNRGFKAGQGISWEGNAGVTYAIGPWAIGIQGGYGEANGNYTKIGEPASSSGNGVDTKAAVALGASYALGPGIQLQAEAQYINWGSRQALDSDSTSSAEREEILDSGSRSHGFAFAFGTALSF
ncbi:MAG: porin [Alphaproteobacteria bacterium]